VTEGEVWARELLADLRADRFRPRAWLAFLRSSFARASETRRERRREHGTVVLLAVAGAGAWVAAGVASLGAPAAAGAAWWLAICLMLDWHLGMLERPDARSLERLGPGNVLSLLRAGLAPALLLVSPAGAAWLLLAAGAGDAIDGPLARRRDEVTRLGRWLDGAGDGVIVGAAALAAPLHALVVALVLVRFGLLWLAVAVAYVVRGRAPGRNGASGRYPGLLLFAGLVLALRGLGIGSWLVVAGALGGLATFAASGLRQRRAAELTQRRLRMQRPR
jgi:phosphatidylglycerophosphate synthase